LSIGFINGPGEKEKVDRGSVVGISKDWASKTFWTVFRTLDGKEQDEFSVSINFLTQKYIHIQMWTRALMTDFFSMVFTDSFVNLLIFLSKFPLMSRVWYFPQ
jgi:hypothetical protein